CSRSVQITSSPHTRPPPEQPFLPHSYPPILLQIQSPRLSSSSSCAAMTVHPTAVSGFGSDTANYDAARPDHQPPAVTQLLQNLDIPAGGTLVEIGSGTGKFTSHLLDRPEKNWKIICVE